MPVTIEPQLLREVPLFDGLATGDLSRLASLLHSRIYPTGADIITIDQPGEVVYIIVSGTVKVHIEQPDGSEVIFALLGPGEVVGEMSLVDSLGRSASVVTMEESHLLWMDRAAFLDCLGTLPRLTYNLVLMFSRRLRLANAKSLALATLDVWGRVARHLLALANEHGEPAPDGVRIPIRLTQNDLAGLAGASRVRVNQVLGEFRRRGYVTVDERHRITIVDREALAAYCT